MIPGANKPV